MDLENRLKEIIAEQLDIEIDKVILESSFTDDLGADSLDLVELIMSFEEEFEQEIPDDVAQTIMTVGDALKYIQDNQ